MKHGFICGKFLPFHTGHEALIRFALERCEQLTVLVCASDQENISGRLRAEWIRASFPHLLRLYIQVLPYLESQLPNTSESSQAVSKLWAKEFQRWVPETDVMFSSEPYGEFVADFMGIQHELFDQARESVPISATQIRAYPHRYWKFIPQVVRPHFCKKIVLLGTESTGKSVLTERLATHFQMPFVAEAGREVIPDSKGFQFEDLYRVAETHAEAIHRGLQIGKPFLFIDTDIHITQSYAQMFFGKQLEVAEQIYSFNRADLYLYLRADAPFIQDGTRLDIDMRNALDQSHRSILESYGVSYVEIDGNWEERCSQAVELIEQFFSL